MSALAQSAGQLVGTASNRFTAHLALASGVSVSIHAETLPDLQAVVAKLQPAANDALPSTAKVKPNPPAPTPAPQPAGNASASTGTPASAPPAASGSASDGDAPRPTYDDIKARVLKLAKIGRPTAEAALGKFGVDHGNKLKLEQYPDFIAHADKVLAEGAKS